METQKPTYDPAGSLDAADAIRARPRECYRNAIMALFVIAGLQDATYVEGVYVTNTGIPFDHGWIETPDGRIIDPTVALLERSRSEDGGAVLYYPGERFSREDVTRLCTRDRATLPLCGMGTPATMRAHYLATREAMKDASPAALAQLREWCQQPPDDE